MKGWKTIPLYQAGRLPTHCAGAGNGNTVKHFVAELVKSFGGSSLWIESLDDFRFAKNTQVPYRESISQR